MVNARPQPKLLNMRFSVFEVNFASIELLKHGNRVKIQKQPFDILCILLERPGEVVSREELRERLWPENTFVEYEDSLNTAIRKLRGALSDSPDVPRFIETVARRGYRFIAPVQAVPVAPKKATTAADIEPQPSANATDSAGTPRPRAQLRVRTWAIPAVLVFFLVAGIAGWLMWSGFRSAQPPTGRVMFAVLPFQNLTGDPNQEYFSDGLTEEMITRLGGLDAKRLGVIARTSVMHYKNTQTPLEQIGRELNVQYVLEGSVRRASDRIRIDAQLIEVKDQTHLWARQYDRHLKDTLAVQGEITQDIADEIRVTLGQTSAAALAKPSLSPEKYEAYDSYLKGQYFFNKRTLPDLETAIGYFKETITRDPGYARAYAGIADSQALIPGYSGRPPGESMSTARVAALKSLEIDDRLPEAHTALALIVQNYEWDWQTAEKEYRRAIELNPNYATAHQWYAEHLMWRGRFDEAFEESERARQLDPLSLIISADKGAIYFFSRQYDRAIEQWRSVLDMDPHFPRAGLIITAYVEKGMFPEALAFVEKQHPLNPAQNQWWYWSKLAYIYGRSGQTAKARDALNELLQVNQRNPIDPEILACSYAALGNKDQAMAWLEKAYAQHSIELVNLKVNPAYDLLRSDPRFRDLLRRIGLDH